MQLPDETITYDYQSLVQPVAGKWSALAELQSQNYLSATQIKEFLPRLLQVRSQVATERELKLVPLELEPLQPGFIDYPQKILDQSRRQGDKSTLSQIVQLADKLRKNAGRVVILGIGGSYLGAKALYDALLHTYHNELSPKERSGTPRIYFEGNNVDNDALHDLFDLLQRTCVDPKLPEERWGVVVISKSGGTIETAAAYRAIRREMKEYYGLHSPENINLVLPVTGATGNLREMCQQDKIPEDQILTIPDDIGGRFSIFTPVGLLPAAVMGLDIRALLLGAAAMTRRFLEEPFERNPVLQFAGINYLLTQKNKPTRVLSVWSKKLESIGFWYDQLLAESLGKLGQGPLPITFVGTRDLHSRGQQLQEGSRDKIVNNLLVKTVKNGPIEIGMADNDKDQLNRFNRKKFPDLMDAAMKGTNQAYQSVARPTADIVLPVISEHALGQLLQMLMIATVIEGRLMGVNPYGQPGVEDYKTNMKKILIEG